MLRFLFSIAAVLLPLGAGAETIKRKTIFHCGEVHAIEIQKWEWADGFHEYGLYVRDRGTGLVVFDGSAGIIAQPTGIQFESKYSPDGSVPALMVQVKTQQREPDGSYSAKYIWSHDPGHPMPAKCMPVGL